jgi:hypothetical protein
VDGGFKPDHEIPRPNILVLTYAVSLEICDMFYNYREQQAAMLATCWWIVSIVEILNILVFVSTTLTTTTTVLPSSALVNTEIISTPTNSDSISNAI